MQIVKELFLLSHDQLNTKYNTTGKIVNNYFHRCCFYTTQRKTPQSLVSLGGLSLYSLLDFLVLRYKPPSVVNGNQISQCEKYSATYSAYNFLLRVSLSNSFQFTVSSLKILDHFWSFAFLFADALSTSSMLMIPVSIIN